MREIIIEEHAGGYVVRAMYGESKICTTPAQVWGFLSEQLGVTGGVGSFEPMPQGDLLSTRDASVWAREFCGVASNLGHVGLDESWVMGWFANAIMSALDSAEQPDPTAETLQEVAEDVTYTTATSFEIDGSKVKYHILANEITYASFDADSWQMYADKCFALGLVPNEEVTDDALDGLLSDYEIVPDPVTTGGIITSPVIGSSSDLSDEDGLIDDTPEQLENDAPISAPRDDLEAAVKEIIDATDDSWADGSPPPHVRCRSSFGNAADTAEAETPEAVTDAVAALADADDYAPTDSEARQQADTQAAANGYARFSPFGQQG